MYMAEYKLGSKGEEVKKIQTRLQELGIYRGLIDGDFGGGTESAVRTFQGASGLDVDGIVGPLTWARLFPGGAIPEPAIAKKSLDYRCLGLTGAIETGAPVPECFAGLSGDFDGQGMSFGALQWNFGQGSLPPLLREMDKTYPGILEGIFGENYPVLQEVLKAGIEDQLSWARSIQDMKRSVLCEPWRGLFKTLGRRDEFQRIELKYASALYREGLKLCATYGVWSERAAALMFDIKVQNGSISPVVRAQIQGDFARLDESAGRDDREVARLKIIANRRAEAAQPRWVEDVRARKLAIANGEGRIHGTYYNLKDQYGIRLKPFKK
jgi:hypothetical protein